MSRRYDDDCYGGSSSSRSHQHSGGGSNSRHQSDYYYYTSPQSSSRTSGGQSAYSGAGQSYASSSRTQPVDTRQSIYYQSGNWTYPANAPYQRGGDYAMNYNRGPVRRADSRWDQSSLVNGYITPRNTERDRMADRDRHYSMSSATHRRDGIYPNGIRTNPLEQAAPNRFEHRGSAYDYDMPSHEYKATAAGRIRPKDATYMAEQIQRGKF